MFRFIYTLLFILTLVSCNRDKNQIEDNINQYDKNGKKHGKWIVLDTISNETIHQYYSHGNTSGKWAFHDSLGRLNKILEFSNDTQYSFPLKKRYFDSPTGKEVYLDVYSHDNRYQTEIIDTTLFREKYIWIPSSTDYNQGDLQSIGQTIFGKNCSNCHHYDFKGDGSISTFLNYPINTSKFSAYIQNTDQNRLSDGHTSFIFLTENEIKALLAYFEDPFVATP